MTMLTRRLFMVVVAIVGAMWPTFAGAAAPPLPACTELATNPAFGLAGNPAVSNLSATVVPVTPGLTRQPGMGQRSDSRIAVTVADCLAEFWFDSGKSGPADGYQPGQRQAIGIRVGLPLRADDGGTGAWNGKIHNLGSGGCMGRFPALTPATNDGYAGAVSDGGHRSTSETAPGSDCEFGVNQSTRTLNAGLLRDFGAEHLIWQTRWSQDGVADGVLADPRTCRWSARAVACGTPGAPLTDCLDADQADAYDTIRRGPRNVKGELIWFRTSPIRLCPPVSTRSPASRRCAGPWPT